ncbi:MAG: fused MFS/spermidine synthase [Dermatophilaceae bacterium]
MTVWRDGFPQSYVRLDDPTVLEFEYVAQMALALDALTTQNPLRATHVGGAGLTLARYIAHTRLGSPQIVLEPDADLTAAVRAELPLPRGHRIRIRAQDGITGVQLLACESADVVLLDAFHEGRVPASLGTIEFLADVARVLAPGGVLIANLADEPGWRYVARVAASAAAADLVCCLVGLHEVLKGRRYGNVVLVAVQGRDLGACGEAALRRAAARCPYPTGVRGPSETAQLARSARPFTARDCAPSPEPCPSNRWRVR